MKKIRIISILVAAIAVMLSAAPLAQATGTGWAHGGNWSSWVGLTNNIIQYPQGITANMTEAQAEAVADTVAKDYIGVGINFVRYPVNPATVSNGPQWADTQYVINELLADGMTVDIGCWYVQAGSGGNGLIPSMTTWKNMWTTVDGVYGSNPNVYYEPINEPYGYSAFNYNPSGGGPGLTNTVYQPFLTSYGITKSQDHIILDAAGSATDVTNVGDWVVANNYNCLLAVHIYPAKLLADTEAAYTSRIHDWVGPYANRTIMTECGALTAGAFNYGVTGTDSNICCIRGVAEECRALGMGFAYFPADQTPDAGGVLNKDQLFNGPGAGLIDQSILNQLQYGWNMQYPLVEYGAAGANAFGNPQIVGVGPEGTIQTKWIESDGVTWSSWEPLNAPSVGTKQWGAIVATNVDGTLEAFVTGNTDGKVYGGWGSWSSLSPSGGGNLSSPAVIADNDGRLNVFVVGSDNGIWWDKQTVADGGWAGWIEIPGTTAASGQAPAVILQQNQDDNGGVAVFGSLEVFYNKSDNSEVCRIMQTTSGGSDWTWGTQGNVAGPNGVNRSGNLSGLSASRNPNGALDVAVVGSDNNVWHDVQTAPYASWYNWNTLDTSYQSVSGQAPCYGAYTDGSLQLFMNANNTDVYRIWQSSPGGSWNTWTPMDGGGHNLTRFWAVNQAKGDLEVFVVGNDNGVYTAIQGTFTTWSPLYGVFDCW